MKTHGDRTIQAAIVSGVFALVTALIMCPHWRVFLDKSSSPESPEAIPSMTTEQPLQKLRDDPESVHPARSPSLEEPVQAPKPDPTHTKAIETLQQEFFIVDANNSTLSNLPKVPNAYIMPTDVIGEVNKSQEKELPAIPKNTIEPDDL